MMIRVLTVSALMAVLSAPAFAQESGQTNPETRQTDQSEEDWRKSRKKRDSGDIFEDIVTNPNNRGTGGIWGGEVKAIDRLDPESRRHLNRLRAKALAEAEPGEPIDAAYEPSEAAKSDEYIARQEQKAWAEMVEEANSGLGGIAQAPAGVGGSSDTQTDSGQGGKGQSSSGGSQGAPSGTAGGQGGSSQSGQRAGGASTSGNSPLRGGSAASASDILNQIKGRGQAPSGNASGQSSTGASPSGQGESNAQAGAQAQNQSPGQDQGQGQSGAQAQAQDMAEGAGSSADNDSSAQSADTPQTASEAQAAAESAAEAAAHAETISPLERLKRDPVDRSETGGRTSASDYLKKKRD